MTNKVDTSLWDIEAKQHSKRVYFNKPQLLTQYIGAKTTVIVAGRRTGKTDSIASPFVLRNIQRMPGSTGGIRSYFGHHSFNHSMMVLSDMPQTTKGSWFPPHSKTYSFLVKSIYDR